MAEEIRQKAVFGHGEEYAALTEQHDQNDRGEAKENRYRDRDREPAEAGHVFLNGIGNGTFFAGAREFGPVGDAGQHVAEQDVENGANRQRAEDAPRHIASGVHGFLRRGGNGVEPDEREEHDTSATEYAAPSVLIPVGVAG